MFYLVTTKKYVFNKNVIIHKKIRIHKNINNVKYNPYHAGLFFITTKWQTTLY